MRILVRQETGFTFMDD